MFAEYLDRHPILELLTEPLPPLYPAAGEAAWQTIPPEYRAEIAEQARQWSSRPYPMRTATGFLAFVRDGSRQADETPYFTRRRKLCWHVLAACLDEATPMDAVIDGLWCICEETSWVISAHNVNPIPGAPTARDHPLPDKNQPYIDLFCAQTGMILALTVHFLKGRLDAVSPLIGQRVRQEIEARVLRPFMTHDEFWWMGFARSDLNNWTPWIISNVMVCACLAPLGRETLAALMDRACRMLDRWLDGMPADGGCDEGAGYWNMAGGSLLDCLEILEKVTDGRMVFWNDGKLRNILTFPLKMDIGGGWFVNFADCDARPQPSGERLQYAGEKLGDPALIAMGCRLRGTLTGQLSDVPHLTRLLSLLFHPAGNPPAAPAPGGVWLPDLQLRVVRRGSCVLCCKGGHNGENHNHNDVGSFMLYMDGQPALVDAGNMVYTAKTFSDQRYTLWNVRAAYHNLPMVGANEQLAGKEHAARDVRCLPDGLSLDMAGAYGEEAGVLSMRREMRLAEDALSVRDTIALETTQPVTWVFMLRHPPCLKDRTLSSGGVRLALPEGLTCEAEEIPVSDPRMARNYPGSLWRVLLTAAEAKTFDMTWTFRKEEQHA